MLKSINYIVPGQFDCTSCGCREAYICLGTASTVALLEDKQTLAATITDCYPIYEVKGQFTETEGCDAGKTTNVIGTSTQLVLTYDTEAFVDENEELSLSDISCVSTDSCGVKTAIESLASGATEVDPIFTASPAFNTTGLNTGDQDISGIATNAGDITAIELKTDFITVTQAVNLDSMETDIAANNAKITNATHTGEVTGATVLTVGPTAISNKAVVALVGTEEVLVNDGGVLKKATAQAIANLWGDAYIAKAVNYTPLAADFVVDCTSTITILLPTAVGIAGKQYSIKNSGVGIITIDGAGAETIDGALTAVLSIQYESITLVSTGANWIII